MARKKYLHDHNQPIDQCLACAYEAGCRERAMSSKVAEYPALQTEGGRDVEVLVEVTLKIIIGLSCWSPSEEFKRVLVENVEDYIGQVGLSEQHIEGSEVLDIRVL